MLVKPCCVWLHPQVRLRLNFPNSPVEFFIFKTCSCLVSDLKPTFFGSVASPGPEQEPDDDSWGPRWSKLEQEGLQAISGPSGKWDQDGLHKSTYIRIYTHIPIHTCILIYTCPHTHMYIYIYIYYIHKYICKTN